MQRSRYVCITATQRPNNLPLTSRDLDFVYVWFELPQIIAGRVRSRPDYLILWYTDPEEIIK